MNRTFELLPSRPVRDVCSEGGACRRDQPLAVEYLTLRGSGNPSSTVFIVDSFDDSGVELDVLVQLPDIGHVLKVSPQRFV